MSSTPRSSTPKPARKSKPGQKGELVITTLTKQAIPLIRYRTRDIVSINYETCKCGRTSPRISKIVGRTDDMIVVRGINVFPSQIETVLLSVEGIQPHYQLIVDRSASFLDELEILVEVEQSIFSDEIKKLQMLEHKIRKEIESVLGIGAKVRLVEPKTIARSEGKAKRVIDKRNPYKRKLPMKITQVSVFLENKKGQIAGSLLASRQSIISISARSMSPKAKASAFCASLSINRRRPSTFSRKIISLPILPMWSRSRLKTGPAALHEYLKCSAKNNINVEYMYGFVEKHSNNALMVFRFDEPEKAAKVLLDNGIKVVKQAQLQS